MDSEARANGEDITLNKLDDIEANLDRLDPSGKVSRMINMNHYATKSVAQSMLDVSLLMANSSQLKTVLYIGSQYRFYKPLIVLLSMYITLQVVVGLLLVFIVKYDLNDVRKHSKLNMMNNTATVFVFFTVVINIFITALGFEGAVIGLPETQVEEHRLSTSFTQPGLNLTGGLYNLNTTSAETRNLTLTYITVSSLYSDRAVQVSEVCTLKKFYSCTIESILTGWIPAWYGNCSASDRKVDRKVLQRVVRTAQYITGAKLPAIQDLYTRRC